MILSYLGGITAVVLPLLVFNYYYRGSFSIIPGNLNNVISCYHGSGLDKLSDSGYRMEFLRNIPVQFLKFISSYEIPNSLSFYAHKDLIPPLNILNIPFNAILTFAAAGIILNFRHKGVRFVALLVLIYIATMLYFEMFYRFRIPLVPLLAVLSSGFFYKFPALELKKQVYIVSVMAVFFYFTYTNPDRLRSESERKMVSVILLNNHHFYKTENYLEKLGDDYIFPEKTWIKLIEAYYKNGDPESAERAMVKYKKYKMLMTRKKYDAGLSLPEIKR
jgi:hypothetical protein